MNTRKWMCAALIGCITLQVTAAAVIYEPFGQTYGSISGKAGGTGLNNWAVVSTASTVTNTPALSYGQLPYSAGQVSVPNGGGITAYVTTTSALSSAGLLNDGATLWFSFLYRKASGGGSNERSGFAFGTDYLITSGTAGASMSNSGNGLGMYSRDKSIQPSVWVGGGGGTQVAGTSFANFGDTVLVVGRIVWGATSGNVETITLWTPNLAALPDVTGLGAGWSLTMTGVDQTLFDTISMQQRDSAGAQIYDEIRFGARYSDVVGKEPSPAYWDINGVTAAAGSATPAETWSAASLFWNNTADGTGTANIWTAGQEAVFAAGTDATGTYTVTVTGTQDIGGLTFEEGTVTLTGGGLRLVNGNSSISVANGLTATVSSPISEDASARSLEKHLLGTLVLSGNNTYTGPTIMNGGTLEFSANNALTGPTIVNGGTLILSGTDNSGATGGLTLNGGAVRFESPAAINGTTRNVTLNLGSVAMFGPSFGAANIPSALLNRIVATSAGAIAADNYAGTDFDFNTAGLTAASLGAVGTVNYTGTLTPNGTTYRLGGGGGTLKLNSACTPAIVSLPGTIQFNGFDATVTGFAGSGQAAIENGSATKPITLTINNAATVTYAGEIRDGTGSQPLTLVKMGANTLTLAGANSFSGGVFINGGTLQVASAANLGDSANGVTFTGNSTLLFTSTVTLSQGFTINAGVTGTLRGGNLNVTINNPLAGSGKLFVFGTSTGGINLTFTSTNNTFSGDIQIRGDSASYPGSLTMNSLDDTPGKRITLGENNSTVSFSYGAGAVVPLVLSNRQIEFYANWEFPSSLNNNATNVNCTVTINTDLLVSRNSAITFGLGGSNTGNNTFGGAITNKAGYVTSLTKDNAGKWILTGPNTYTGTTTLKAGTLSISKMADYGQPSPIGNGTAGTGIAFTGGALVYTGAGDNTDRLIQVSGGSGTILNNGAGALNFMATGNFNVPGSTTSARTLSLGGTNGGTISGAIQNNTGTAPALSLAKIDNGVWILAGNNTYTGNTDVNAGSLTLQSSATTITQTLGALRNQLADGTLILNKSGAGNISTTFSSYARAAGATGNILSTGGSNGTDNSVNITGAAGFIDKGLYFGGSEFAARNAVNGYVRALAYGSDASTVAADTVTANNHVKLTTTSYSGAGVTLLSLNLAAGEINWANTSGTLTVPGILKSGGGSQSTISGGTLATTSNAELLIRTDTSSDSLLISSVINSGSGTLTKSGAGTLTLSGANTYTGQTHINAGTLSISANNNLGSQTTGATLNLKGGTLQATGTFGLFNGTAGTNNRAVTLLDQSTIDVTGANTLTIAGVMSNNGSAGFSTPGFNKTGTGTLILSGANTYTGETVISGGKLALGGHNVFNGKPITLSGGTLDAGTYTNALSTLKVSGSGTIVMSPGAVLAFADSRAIQWGGTLNLSGVFAAGTSLRFGTSSAGLTTEQLASLTATGYTLSLDADGYLKGRPSGTLIYFQ